MKCKLAFLHAAVQIPGIFSTEATLSQEKLPGMDLDMRVVDGCEVGVLTVRGHQIVIPLAAFKCLTPAVLLEVIPETVVRKAGKQQAIGANA